MSSDSENEDVMKLVAATPNPELHPDYAEWSEKQRAREIEDAKPYWQKGSKSKKKKKKNVTKRADKPPEARLFDRKKDEFHQEVDEELFQRDVRNRELYSTSANKVHYTMDVTIADEMASQIIQAMSEIECKYYVCGFDSEGKGNNKARKFDFDAFEIYVKIEM